MKTQQFIVLLMLLFFTTGIITIGLTGCSKTHRQELAEKKAKEDFRKGTFQPSTRKSY